MDLRVVIKDIDEHCRFAEEGVDHKGVWKELMTHRPIVNVQEFVDV
jgi:hypothetical protein